jgi:hypothetical protein
MESGGIVLNIVGILIILYLLADYLEVFKLENLTKVNTNYALYGSIGLLVAYAITDAAFSDAIPTVFKEYAVLLVVVITILVIAPRIPFVRDMQSTALWIICFYGLWIGLKSLAESASKHQAPSVSSGPKPRTLERFENTEVSLLEKVQAAIQRVQEDMETLVNQEDDTCAIIQEVEDGYVGVQSAPPDESEFSLPKGDQYARKTVRQTRAKSTFQKLWALKAGAAGILECFQSGDSALQSAAMELQGLLESEEALATLQKADKMVAALQFARSMMDRGGISDGFQNPSGKSLDTLTGKELEAAVQSLLAKEATLHRRVLEIQELLNPMRSTLNKQYKKGAMLESGKYSGYM